MFTLVIGDIIISISISHFISISWTYTKTTDYSIIDLFLINLKNIIYLYSNLDEIYRLLEAADGLIEHRTVEMEHGQKKSRIVAWTFHDEAARIRWFNK